LMQTCCSILPSIADKTKHKVEKAHVQKQCVFTVWCHVVDWCNRLAEVWPWPPLIFFHRHSYNNNSLGNFQYHHTQTMPFLLLYRSDLCGADPALYIPWEDDHRVKI
jgi:hypothetical protein